MGADPHKIPRLIATGSYEVLLCILVFDMSNTIFSALKYENPFHQFRA